MISLEAATGEGSHQPQPQHTHPYTHNTNTGTHTWNSVPVHIVQLHILTGVSNFSIKEYDFEGR